MPGPVSESFDPEPDYLEIPIEEARDLAQDYEKEWVLIVGYDGKFDCVHLTTYGVEAQSKILVAKMADRLARQMAEDGETTLTFEDFRNVPQAQYKKRVDNLEAEVARLREVEAVARSIYDLKQRKLEELGAGWVMDQLDRLFVKLP